MTFPHTEPCPYCATLVTFERPHSLTPCPTGHRLWIEPRGSSFALVSRNPWELVPPVAA